MGSGPSENKVDSGRLDLNSSASEHLETLAEIPEKEDEKVEEVAVGAEYGGAEKGGGGFAKVVAETSDSKDAGDGAAADAGEVETAAKVETPLADKDLVFEKSPEIGSTFSLETGGDGGGGDRVGGQGSGSKKRRGRPRRSAGLHDEKGTFAPSDIVWGKVRSHPWWPAQIFDLSDASEMATNVQKKDHYLVAYYGDKTFAWCDESQLKPFYTYFSQMEKQNNMDAFVTAVNTALLDVSRRVELGMTCHCFRDENFASLRDQKFENTGVQEGKSSYAADKSSTVASFDPLSLIDYIQTSAEFPLGEVDKLKLAVTKSQLTAFYRSKGYSKLPEFVIGLGPEENTESSSLEEKKTGKEVGNLPSPSSSLDASGKGKSSGSGGSIDKQKRVVEHGRKRKSLSKLMETDSDHQDADSKKGRSRENSRHSSRKKQQVENLDVTDSEKGKKSLSKLMEGKSDRCDTYSKKSGSGENTKHSSGRKLEVDSLDAADSGKGKKSISKLMEIESDQRNAISTKSGSGENTKHSSRRKLEVDYLDAADSGKGKKKKLDSLGDLVNKPKAQNTEKQSLFGERMSRVAGLLTGSPPILKPNGETTKKSSTKLSKKKGDTGDDIQVDNYESKDNSSDEMLSQLCTVARGLLKERDFISKISGNATDSKSCVSASNDKKHTGTVAGKRGRRKSTNVKSDSSEMTTLEHKKDEGCSDIVHSEDENLMSSEHKTKGKLKRKEQKMHQSTDEEAPSPPLHSVSDTGQRSKDSSIDRSNMLETGGVKLIGDSMKDESANPCKMQECEGDLQKEVDEFMPTALVLTFNEQDAIPAEADLIKIFGKYGSLRESETEVSKSENRAKIVFKRRSDAEVALDSAGKNSILGGTLVSYKLRFLQSSPKASPTRIQEALPVDAGSNSNVSVKEDGGAISDKLHVDANGLAG